MTGSKTYVVYDMVMGALALSVWVDMNGSMMKMMTVAIANALFG
jgi:hypothetical protein